MRPSLKVTGLHIEGLRSIRRLDWPADGLGWGGVVPDTVMIGGVNGSGKTTLLSCLAAGWLALSRSYTNSLLDPSTLAEGTEIQVTFLAESAGLGSRSVDFLVGDNEFVYTHRTPGSFGVTLGRRGGLSHFENPDTAPILAQIKSPERFRLSGVPRVVYFTSEGRTLVNPATEFKAAGGIARTDQIVYVWHAPKKWAESTEALLYSARWADLNAKEEGRPEEATHFQSYASAYEAFFEGGKRVAWHRGELVVEVPATGARHRIEELSSGEKQILVMASELLYWWKPGSLILIDEPEMHLHVTWQLKLWEVLLRWQKERGGQVIVATQSTDLFAAAEPGTHLLLGGPLP